jgi:hypothetical protein
MAFRRVRDFCEEVGVFRLRTNDFHGGSSAPPLDDGDGAAKQTSRDGARDPPGLSRRAKLERRRSVAVQPLYC